MPRLKTPTRTFSTWIEFREKDTAPEMRHDANCNSLGQSALEGLVTDHEEFQ